MRARERDALAVVAVEVLARDPPSLPLVSRRTPL